MPSIAWSQWVPSPQPGLAHVCSNVQGMHRCASLNATLWVLSQRQEPAQSATARAGGEQLPVRAPDLQP